MKYNSVKTLMIMVAALMTLGACTSDNKGTAPRPYPVKVQVMRPEKKTINSISVAGQLESAATAVLSTRIMGFITRINVKPGDKVAKGELLITINSDDVRAKRAQAKAMIAEADAALNDARKDLERYNELFATQSASAKELENIQLHYESMKARKETARQLEQEANAMIAYTDIVAPFSGVVTQKFAAVGSMASPGAPLLIIEKEETWQATTLVAELDIDKVRVGANAEVVIKSTNLHIQGKVSEVSPSANQGGQYIVKVALRSDKSTPLHSGAQVSVTISGIANEVSDQAIVVPAAALVHKDQLVGLYTLSENNTALLRWIKTGRAFSDKVEVLAGINENELFIASSEGRLYNGVPLENSAYTSQHKIQNP